MPPTFAADITITSGVLFSINFFVASKENRSVDSLLDFINLETLGEFFKTLVTEDPTSPLLPTTRTLIVNLKHHLIIVIMFCFFNLLKIFF